MSDSPQPFQTVLFADIADSIRLYDRLGDASGRSLVAAAIDLMNAVVHVYHGHVIKTIGDEIMCRFDSPAAAIKAAVGMNEALSDDCRLADQNVRLRIGFHHGPVIAEDNDLFGDAVNIAARMTAQAKAGQIITSGQTLGMVSDSLRAMARMVDQALVKGKSDPIAIFEILWGQPEELTVMSRGGPRNACRIDPGSGCLMLEVCGQPIRIDGRTPVVTLGRDPGNRLVVNNPKVSRLHAQLEVRKDKVILIDKSTNGTYVYPRSGKSIHLHRDAVALDGDGFFIPGEAAGPDSPLAIHYAALGVGG